MSAVIGGFWPGIFATLLGLFSATFIFLPPHYSLSFASLTNAFWPNLVFLSDGLVVCFAIETMHRYRVQHEEELKESRATNEGLLDSSRHLRQILDHMPASVAWLEVNGTLIEANHVALQQIQLQLVDIVGKFLYELPLK